MAAKTKAARADKAPWENISFANCSNEKLNHDFSSTCSLLSGTLISAIHSFAIYDASNKPDVLDYAARNSVGYAAKTIRTIASQYSALALGRLWDRGGDVGSFYRIKIHFENPRFFEVVGKSISSKEDVTDWLTKFSKLTDEEFLKALRYVRNKKFAHNVDPEKSVLNRAYIDNVLARSIDLMEALNALAGNGVSVADERGVITVEMNAFFSHLMQTPAHPGGIDTRGVYFSLPTPVKRPTRKA